MDLAPPVPPPDGGPPAAAPADELALTLLDSGIEPQQLVLFLPIATAVVLAARLVVGLRTVGTFAPALLGLAVLQLGWASTASALLISGGAAAIAITSVDRLHLSPSSRLTVLVSSIVVALVLAGFTDESGAALPIIVLAILFERADEQLRVDGPVAALRSLATTMLVAATSALVIVALAPTFAGQPWVVPAAVGLVANLAIGSYRGLRLTELRRFGRVVRRPHDLATAR